MTNQKQAEIVKHLPFLRRYARALTGSQVAGDRYIRACLEGILADKPDLMKQGDARRELYRWFHDTLGTVDRLHLEEPPPEPGSAPDTVQGRLEELPAKERQILLLTSLEAFDIADAAYITRLTPDKAIELQRNARNAMLRQKSTTVLIIEDEPAIGLALQDLMTSAGHTVVGIAATKDEAVKMASEKEPGLVLADIRLHDGSSGVEAVQEILSAMKVPVVFITAYPEYLLTGERPEPTFLVTKPFKNETVVVTVSQAMLSAERG
jgi:CheY-like chemotaxis protein